MMRGAARPAIASLAAGIAMALLGVSHAQDAAKPDLAKGREVFDNYACGSCHSLADAGASAHVGPGFDGNTKLNEAFVIDRVSNGEGAMPAFKDQLSKEEIAALAAYVVQASKK
jgi:mono/diheme cytochrome c family protein